MERERGAARERVPFPNSNSNSNPYPNSDPVSSQHKISTVFVRNLPPTLDLLGLRGIFSRVGKVEEVSIPAKQEGFSRFGFVKFENHGVASRSIRVGNNRWVRGSKIAVCFARRDLFRFRQDFTCRYRQNQSPANPRPDFNPKRAVDTDLLASLGQKLAAEIEKMGQLRKALESILESFEGLVDSKSVRTIIGVLSEVADNLKEAYPSLSPSPLKTTPIPDNPPPSSSVGLSGDKEGGAKSCSVEVAVVEGSFSTSKHGPEDLEEGEIIVKEFEEDDGGSKSAEVMDVEAEKPIPDADLDPDYAPDQICFSFNSKSNRRRKKANKSRARKRVGKSRGRQPNFYPKSGEKRKLSCQGSHPYQGDVKKLKRSIDPTQQGQSEADPAIEASNNSPAVYADGGEVGVIPDSPLVDEDGEESSDEGDEENSEALASQGQEDESFGLEKLFASCGEDEGANPMTKAVVSSDNGIQESSRRRINTSPRRKIVIGEGPQDNFKRSAFRAVNLCNRLGLKVFKNEEAAVRKAARIIKNQKRYVESYSSSENSLGSAEF